MHSCLTPLCLHGFSPQASICRSSQPLSGFSARCLEDEQMLQAIRKANPGSDFIYVVDTRPKVGIAILMRVFAALDHEIGHKAKLLNDCHHPLGLLHLRRGCSSSQSQHLDALHGCFLGVLSSWLCQVLQIFPLLEASCWVHSAHIKCMRFNFGDHTPKCTKFLLGLFLK